MSECTKRILIFDEERFSRVCSALLEGEGYRTDTIMNGNNVAHGLNNNEFGLIVMSYPYGVYILHSLRNKKIPVIILSDHMSRDLICMLEDIDNAYCMIKPIDFEKFKVLVREVMNKNVIMNGGYKIV